MGRVGFKAENKVATTNYDYPKLKLKVGERARIMVGLEDPIVEYVHTLRKPQIVNGVPQMTTEKTRAGQEYQTNVMDFVSRPLCLGDKTILDARIAPFVANIGAALYTEDGVLRGNPDVVGNIFDEKAPEYNVTAQMKLVKEDPQRARSLMAAAGKKPEDFGLAANFGA